MTHDEWLHSAEQRAFIRSVRLVLDASVRKIGEVTVHGDGTVLNDGKRCGRIVPAEDGLGGYWIEPE